MGCFLPGESIIVTMLHARVDGKFPYTSTGSKGMIHMICCNTYLCPNFIDIELQSLYSISMPICNHIRYAVYSYA